MHGGKNNARIFQLSKPSIEVNRAPPVISIIHHQFLVERGCFLLLTSNRSPGYNYYKFTVTTVYGLPHTYDLNQASVTYHYYTITLKSYVMQGTFCV